MHARVTTLFALALAFASACKESDSGDFEPAASGGESSDGDQGDGDGDGDGDAGDGDGDGPSGGTSGDGDGDGPSGGTSGDGNSGTGGALGGEGGGDGDGLPAGCLDTTDFEWSEPELVETLAENDARRGAVALDAQGRAFALLEGSVGASVNLRFVTYDPQDGWTTADPVADSLEGGVSWYPDAVASPSGNVIASYRRIAGGGSIQLAVFASDTEGTLGIDGLGVSGDSNLFHGGVALSDDGTQLIAYSDYETDGVKVFASANFEEATPVITGPSGAYASNTSMSPDGYGFVFGGSYGSDTIATAVPYASTGGWGEAEPLYDSGYSAGNGFYGASLGGGEAVAAFGSIGTATRVQMFASYRSAEGDWSTPKRFDSGDDSAHAMLEALAPGAEGEAFALWSEPDGFSAGRFEGSSDLVDEIEFGLAFNYWSLAADRCGNAAVFYSTMGTNDAHYRYYRRGEGWLPAATIETGAGTAAVAKDLTFSSTGEAMLLFVRSDRFYFSRFGPAD